jgi:hypothetical protein
MILDKENQLADAQALSATGYTTNTVDGGTASPVGDAGSGEPMALLFTVTTAADLASGDETYQFQIVQSANANLSSHDVLSQTDTSLITKTVLVAGYQVIMPIPPGLVTKRYLGGRVVLGGTTPSISVSCYLVPLSLINKYKAYAKNYTIS